MEDMEKRRGELLEFFRKYMLMEIRLKGADEGDEFPDYTYQEYLATHYWVELAKRIKERDKYCQLCGRLDRLECHHRTYKNFPFQEEDEDLITFCHTCHLEAHFHRALSPPKLKRIKQPAIRRTPRNKFRSKSGRAWDEIDKWLDEEEKPFDAAAFMKGATVKP